MNSEDFPGSVWRHYKGGHYKVLALAHPESDPGETVVVYQALQGGFGVWTRPIREWFERVNTEPGTIGVGRFELLGHRIL